MLPRPQICSINLDEWSICGCQISKGTLLEDILVIVFDGEGAANWGDFDNDNDLDFLLTGAHGGTYSSLCINNGMDNFEEVNLSTS